MARPKNKKSLENERNTLALELAEEDVDSFGLPDLKKNLKLFGDKAVGSKSVLLEKLKHMIKEFSGEEVEVEEEEVEADEEVEDEIEAEEEDEIEAEEVAEEEVEEPAPKKTKAKAKVSKSKAKVASKSKAKAKVAAKAPKSKAKAKSKVAAKVPKAKAKAKAKVATKAPKAKAKAKVVVKSKAKVATKAKSKAKAKVATKGKAKAKPKEENEDEDDENIEDDPIVFPSDVEIPAFSYCIKASHLAQIINVATEETEDRTSFYKKIFKDLEAYVVANEFEPPYEPPYGAITPQAESKVSAKSKKGKAGKKAKIEEVEEVVEEEEAVEEEVEEVVEEEEAAEEEVVEEEVEEAVSTKTEEMLDETKESIKIGYNASLGAYTDKAVKFVWDKNTASVFAKVLNGKIVPLQKADLADEHVRFWHIISEKRDKIPSIQEINTLVKATVRVSPKAVAKVTKEAAVVIEEMPEEGGDDGETTDVVDLVEKETEKLTEKVPSVDEDSFNKFVTAQYSGAVSRSDYIAVSKKAGISEAIGEQIMLQYVALSDRFPHVLTNAAVKKNPPPNANLGAKAQLQIPSQRRLLKK